LSLTSVIITSARGGMKLSCRVLKYAKKERKGEHPDKQP